MMYDIIIVERIDRNNMKCMRLQYSSNVIEVPMSSPAI